MAGVSLQLRTRVKGNVENMANASEFNHDFVGHLLTDKLMAVPPFQRRYSWQETNVEDYLTDIRKARDRDEDYFMGTIVLAHEADRYLIVDGQQRIITTSLLFIAIRDRLKGFEHGTTAESIDGKHLRGWDEMSETHTDRLGVAPQDTLAYKALLAGTGSDEGNDLTAAFAVIQRYVERLAPTPDEYQKLVILGRYLDTRVQVLLAIASGLPEAYVIFETLNDRGADLTTADLLKNYVFSHSGDELDWVSGLWTRLAGYFSNSDEFVKFIRQELMSRIGRVTHRELYKALRGNIEGTPNGVRAYMKGLDEAHSHLEKLDPDNIYWSSEPQGVRDSLLALRRFRFDSTRPLLLAVFNSRKWKKHDKAKFINTMIGWFIRAWAHGALGDSQSEKAICEAAVAVSTGRAKTTADVLSILKPIVPDDAVFRSDFEHLGSINNTNAKYLLSRLEQQESDNHGESLPDWNARTTTVEHIFAKSSTPQTFENSTDYDHFTTIRDTLTNYTLLEHGMNGDLENKTFLLKREAYKKSAFPLTRQVGANETWSFEKAHTRMTHLADLAVKAWPL